mmetsp:Transcript_130635/g.225937  ORF Transcript_130635/g.225937 Transcript_130635/m.225937 type:complete len:317 (+) Transcript_130635:2485-3435(+)
MPTLTYPVALPVIVKRIVWTAAVCCSRARCGTPAGVAAAPSTVHSKQKTSPAEQYFPGATAPGLGAGKGLGAGLGEGPGLAAGGAAAPSESKKLMVVAPSRKCTPKPRPASVVGTGPLSRAQMTFIPRFTMARSRASPVSRARRKDTVVAPLVLDALTRVPSCWGSGLRQLRLASVVRSLKWGFPAPSTQPKYTSPGPIFPGTSVKPTLTYPCVFKPVIVKRMVSGVAPAGSSTHSRQKLLPVEHQRPAPVPVPLVAVVLGCGAGGATTIFSSSSSSLVVMVVRPCWPTVGHASPSRMRKMARACHAFMWNPCIML